MDAQRKLHEIDTKLKRVQEGLGEFDALWESHRCATQPNQRERIEEQMKLLDKRLQRDRVQIKAWIAEKGPSQERKDALVDAQKRIEVVMARHKDFEQNALAPASTRQLVAHSTQICIVVDTCLQPDLYVRCQGKDEALLHPRAQQEA